MRYIRRYAFEIMFVLGALTGAAILTPAEAQQLVVATGSPAGTYSNMFKTMKNMCPSSSLQMTEKNTTGSIDNLDQLVGNQINAAFVQSDVLAFRARTEDLSALKALLVLHQEEVHFIALSATKKEGGWLGGRIGGTTYTLKDVADLQGRQVGAVGGSVISAKLISALSGLKYNVQVFTKNEEALEAVRTGKIDAMVAVGGAPLQVVTQLTPDFRLLTVPAEVTSNERLMATYSPVKVTYNNMNAMGVQTISVPAMLITRDYKTAGYVKGLTEFRSCILNKLDEIKETTGTHAKWQQVQVLSKDSKTAWPIYQR